MARAFVETTGRGFWANSYLGPQMPQSRVYLKTSGPKLGISYRPEALRDHLNRDTALALVLAVVYMRTSSASTVNSRRHSSSTCTGQVHGYKLKEGRKRTVVGGS